MTIDIPMYERDEPDGPSFKYEYLMSRLRYVVDKARQEKMRQQQVDGIKRATGTGGATAGVGDVKPKKKPKAKAKAKTAAGATVEATETAPGELVDLSAFTKKDARSRGYCFAFNRGFCSKGKDCKYEHQKAKTRERSGSADSRKSEGKGKDVNERDWDLRH